MAEDDHNRDYQERPSKSARKREMLALQALGERLIDLRPATLAALPVSEKLSAAVAEARRIRSHEARRRQLQYIGKLMRSEDAEGITAALDAIDNGQPLPAERERRAELEQRIADLLEQPEPFEAILAQWPDVERGRLAQLLRGVERAGEDTIESDRRQLFDYLDSLT